MWLYQPCVDEDEASPTDQYLLGCCFFIHRLPLTGEGVVGRISKVALGGCWTAARQLLTNQQGVP